MPRFHYRAMTASGATVRGAAEAASEAALVEMLHTQGQFPLSAEVQPTAKGLQTLMLRLHPKRRLSARSLATTTAELASLLAAGLELDHALAIVCNLSGIGGLRAPLENARSRVRAGESFADALAAQKLFSPFYVSLVRAGEMAGNLQDSLNRLADYLNRSLAVREAITSALVYPAILLITAGVSVIIILTVVLPEFQPVFAQAGKALPWPTQLVMTLGGFLQTFWWALALAALAMTLWLRTALSRPAFRLRFDRGLLDMPLLGPLLAAIDIERFERGFGTLLRNGVALPQALALVCSGVANHSLAATIGEAATQMRAGASLAPLLGRDRHIPAVTCDLIRIGEETGKLAPMLLRQADLDEQRLRHTLDRLIALIVPVLTIVLGLVVGGLIASLLLAMLQMNDLVLQ